MSDDQFTKLFRYIENRFGDIETKVESRASQKSVNLLINAIDTYAGKLEMYAQEMAAMQHKIDRLEKSSGPRQKNWCRSQYY